MKLDGKVALVTGGGRGIGRGISLLFAREGARLVLAARGEEPLARTAEEIEAAGREALVVPTDVSVEEDLRNAVDAAVERFGTVDILVNNAGINANKRVDLASVEEYDQIVDTNLKGTWMGCHYVAPVMMEAGGGVIINIASVHGISGLAGMSAYAASKGGIISATRVIALDLAPFNIRVNAISPGAILLPEPIERAREQVREEDHDEFETRFADRYWDAHRYVQPLDRVGEPEDIARCAVFLASEDARFITGQNIVVDGGATLKIPYRGPGQPSEKIFTALEEMRLWMGRRAQREP
jgi:NAD(P)-dependent dehydrogenase (short-subunit alcohol dehydrogenase family)